MIRYGVCNAPPCHSRFSPHHFAQAADTGRSLALFDGKTLNGWQVCNGQATYRVENGAIIGRDGRRLSQTASFAPPRDYGDFVLETSETKTAPELNSGVQIRGHRYVGDAGVQIFNGKETVQRKFPAGRVYGYQVEVADREERYVRVASTTRRGAAGCATSQTTPQRERVRSKIINGTNIASRRAGITCAFG